MQQFESKEALAKKWESLQKQGKMPFPLRVNHLLEPFWAASNGGSGLNDDGEYVVTIRAYIPGAPPMVQISYPNDDAALISLDELFIATLPSGDAIERLEEELRAEREAGNVMAYDELDILRVQRLANKIDNQQFNSRVSNLIRETSKQWREQKDNGTFDQMEYDRTRQKIGDVITIMNSPGRVTAFAALQGTEWLDKDSYAEGVRLAIEYTFACKDAPVQDKKDADPKKTFNAGLKEISKILDELPADVRIKAFSSMNDEMLKRVIANLPPAQQLRVKRELISANRLPH